MPVYDYKCEKCETIFEKSMSISERELPTEEECPNCFTSGHVIKLINSINIGDPIRLGVTKPSEAWKDVLRNIHKRAPGSNLDKTSTLAKI